ALDPANSWAFKKINAEIARKKALGKTLKKTPAKTSAKTNFELDENEKVLSVRKYALKWNAIKELQIFRVEKSQMAIFVSGKVKEEIERNNITGCDFLEVKVV
ncbi:imm11 family protein, partial [Paenibacillus popilliae]